MFEELPVGLSQAVKPADQMPPMPITGVLAPSPPPSPEEARAVEALFAAQEQESNEVAALFGIWTGAMLLNDLAKETFSKPAGEVPREKPKNRDDERP